MCSQSEKGETALDWGDQEGLPGGGGVLRWSWISINEKGSLEGLLKTLL